MTDTRTPISAQALAAQLTELDRIGVGSSGVNRLAWTEEDAACRSWFERQAAAVGLAIARDPAGNLWACPDAPGPWWAVGSHLDSVRDGGRFDGPLGVVCGFAIAAGDIPVAVISFGDEEGARFNTPTFGSKALVGRLDLDTVLRESDFVVVICLLTPQTHHLIGPAQLRLMRPSAYLINTARGPIVDETALIAALREGRIAGAALDVFEQEPVDPANPLLTMDNVIVTPHALCWTDECFRGIAESGFSSIIATLQGRWPRNVVNREVHQHPRVAAWLTEQVE